MTPAEHYVEAERLFGLAEAHSWYVQDGELPRVAVIVAAAQVHATLALAPAVTQ